MRHIDSVELLERENERLKEQLATMTELAKMRADRVRELEKELSEVEYEVWSK